MSPRSSSAVQTSATCAMDRSRSYPLNRPSGDAWLLTVRVLGVALAGALGIVVALVAGFLVWIDGVSPAGAVLTGGTAFAGTLVLALAVAGVLWRGL